MLNTLGTIDQEDIDPFAGAKAGGSSLDMSQEAEDDEQKSDSVSYEDIERVVNYSDMSQDFKGENINFIGQIESLGVKTKNQLKDLDYADLDGGEGEAKPKNKFLQKQEDDRKKAELMRQDKHLLPQEFKDAQGRPHKDDFGKLPYSTIDLIFNHKNIWANLQNPNPQVIWYHIHKNTEWLPLVTDPFTKHPKIQERDDIENGVEQKPPPMPGADKEKGAKKKNKKG